MAAENTKPSDLDIIPKYLLADDEGLSQECLDLIATLPSEPDWFATRLYQCQGFWHTKRLTQGILNFQSHFEARDSDIFLVTFPKCGTTWLKALTSTLLNRKIHYPNPNPDLTRIISPHPLFTVNPQVLVPLLEFIQPAVSSFPSPRLLATHLPYVSLPESLKQSRCKIIYMCRNPKDAFVSLWHFGNKLRPDHNTRDQSNKIDDAFEKFCRGVSIFGPLWDHVLGYYKESVERPEKIMFLKYEQLKDEPVKILKKLAEFIGCGFSKEEEDGDVISDILKLRSFETLSNLEVNKKGKLPSGVENKVFFRRGEVGDSKNFLTADMIQRLNAITQEKLGKHGLKF
ncbi:cytosolic sulfotransferase 12-like [Prosopis cineraria]|uniref:cytosolic sulfotransferase 12-like n=1 Tax=Prosopis cineraria TaxID=364024 RepID=UPI0024107DE1|nr:cytosolic sulfotransferase 12-like [Prosopis cineraria]XP_054822992.1 cytosolic sulfotransferase 12-like [Prosopis cineraria]